MGAGFHDFSFIHYAYHVGIFDGRQAVGYHDCGAVLHESVECRLHELLILAVERRGCLVENEYGRILQDGAGYGETLALSSREPASAVAYAGVIAMFRFDDEFVGIGYLCRFLHLLLGGIVDAESDIVVEGVVEQDSLLIHIAHEAAQLMHFKVAYVDAVDKNLPLVDVVESRQEVGECRFARSALSHDSHGRSCGDLQRHVVHHRFLTVGKCHVAIFDVALKVVDVLWLGGILDGIVGIEDFIHAFH